MLSTRLTALALAVLMSPLVIAATTASGTGPTNPVETPRAPALQSAPLININGTGVDSNLPPSTGTDPRIQGNDAGRQGGLNLPDTKTPDNASPGIGSTTTESPGSLGGASQ
ncbi:hypothetical protein [Pseudomonas umsongensis]|uniref:hypothetical protein n=1 Tax=Pseudomonas umsongensis TaxID=198618 RepID=UPI0015B973A2|nr:hypothetical protein [Pseudomonas umsongensis]NWL21311.1 hypothetical protein [Pseudomonas umsongensis]